MKHDITSLVRNKQMSDETFKQRRETIKIIHEARRFVDLPRITVRVAEKDSDIAGVARLGKNVIWITEGFVANYGVVLHEILHAVFSIDHIEGCPLMSGRGTSLGLSKKKAFDLFIKYSGGSKTSIKTLARKHKSEATAEFVRPGF